MDNNVVYTAIANNYDKLKPTPSPWRSAVRFVAFLDSPRSRLGWDARPVYQRFRDPCRNAKVHKVLSHRFFPEAEYTLWVDGSVTIIPSFTFPELINEFLKSTDLAVFKHFHRKCVYEQGAWCLAKKLDLPQTINRQMQRYYDEGYPANNGMAHCLVLFRRQSKKIKLFNEMWYEEIKKGSRRDQLSFNYVAHKLGVKITYIPGNIWQNPNFRLSSHQKKRYEPD